MAIRLSFSYWGLLLLVPGSGPEVVVVVGSSFVVLWMVETVVVGTLQVAMGGWVLGLQHLESFVCLVG